jgi:hypothetical protein
MLARWRSVPKLGPGLCARMRVRLALGYGAISRQARKHASKTGAAGRASTLPQRGAPPLATNAERHRFDATKCLPTDARRRASPPKVGAFSRENRGLVERSGNHMSFAGTPLGNGRERSRESLGASVELQNTLRQAIVACGRVRPGRRVAADA